MALIAYHQVSPYALPIATVYYSLYSVLYNLQDYAPGHKAGGYI